MEKVWLKSYPQGVPAEIDVSEFRSLGDLFERSVRRFADKTAYICMGKSMTYAELDALSARFGTELRQVSNLDATILGHDDGLRSCYFCGNFGDDGLFVIQIETHGQSP